MYGNPEAGIDAFNSVRSIHDLPDGRPIVKELLYMTEIPFPDNDSTRELSPFLFECSENHSFAFVPFQYEV